MAANVSYLMKMMKGGDPNEQKSTFPITKDFLGGSRTLHSTELDLDLQVPCGWEKRLDLQSGKVYLQRCNSLNSSASDTSETKSQTVKTSGNNQDFSFAPMVKQQQTLNLFDDASLDLKLVPSSSNYQSVCTLDKVKFALERAERETESKRSVSISSSPRSYSASSTKDNVLDHEDISAPYAAGCPCCLLYVLISRNNPKCPRCNSNVPLPFAAKKPRIDLNMSI